MPSDGNQINAQRLCDAADAALDALVDAAGRTGRVPAWPANLVGPDAPACLRGYTRDEIEQAGAFLVRLGAIEHPRHGVEN